MTGYKTKGIWIAKAPLLRIWRMFKGNPKKVFVRYDFGRGNYYSITSHLNVLMKMKLIERVNVVYSIGRFGRVRERKIYGYKLLKEEIRYEDING